MYAVQWIDNKPVTLLSTYCAVDPLCELERFDKRNRSVVKVPTPSIVSTNNKHMGYVDEVISYLARYKLTCQSRSRYYLKIFHHFINLMVTNAWLKYSRNSEACKVPAKEILSLYDFKARVGQALLKVGTTSGHVGIGDIDHAYLVKRRCGGRKTIIPPQEVRLDNIGHWPIAAAKGPRCKNPDYDAKPLTM